MDPVATCERRAKRAKRTRGVFICAFVAYLRVVRVRSCSSGDATEIEREMRENCVPVQDPKTP